MLVLHSVCISHTVTGKERNICTMLLQADDGNLSVHSIIARDDTCRVMHISASHQEEEEGRGKPNQPQRQTDQSDQQVWPLVCERANTTLGGVVSWQPLTRFILPIFRICKCHGQNKKTKKTTQFHYNNKETKTKGSLK